MSIRYLLLSLISILIAYNFIPAVAGPIDYLFGSLFGGDYQDGSSMDMRDVQLEACIAVASQFPIFGGGLDYIQESMGFGSSDFGLNEFYGFESYFYKIIIERGGFGVFMEIALVTSLLSFFLKNKKNDSKHAGLGFATIVGFYIFSLATGVLETWTICMLLVGYSIKKIENSTIMQV